ncbi:hypothetical protein CHUAL_009020 [Chamberlinius hualienensis]
MDSEGITNKDEIDCHLRRGCSKSMCDLSNLEANEDVGTEHGNHPSLASSSKEPPSDIGSPTHSRSGGGGGKTYWRKKGQQLSSWWGNLKKFAPQRLARSRSRERAKQMTKCKELQQTSTRLSSSHPDVSYTNLAEFARNYDDERSYSAGASLTSSPRRMAEVTCATPVDCSRMGSPKFIKRPSSAGEASSASVTDHSQSTGRLSAEPPGRRSPSPDLRLATAKVSDIRQSPSFSSENAHFIKLRHALLRQHPFFELDVFLKSGQNLVAKDSCGTSDPYVKFKIGGKLVHKSKTVSKNLNPEWNERFTVALEDAFQNFVIKVFDHDWGLQDDFMGSAVVDLASLEIYTPTEMALPLTEPGKPETMGLINLTLTLNPRSQEDKEQYFHRSAKLSETNKKLKSQIWSSVVTIVLVEGKNIGLHHPGVQYSSSSKDDTTICPGVKFRLGNGKYKSKCAQRTCNPLWREQVDLHMFDDQSKILEITVYDGNRIREEIIGRCTIDLNELEHEKTLGLWKELHDGNGSIHLLLTISGTTQSETISDLTNYEFNPKEREAIVNRYNLYSTFNNLKDIGHVTVKVFKAQNLAAADIGGKSDPFCVLELVNARLQTQTEYKTLSPSWQKIFTFNVKDIHSVLEVTVYDEDRDHKVEFLGKVEIPLLRIQNGERKWYQLKDKKLHGRVKGQILLEMEVAYNSIRSCIRTFNPKEEKYMEQEEKFKRQVFVNNVLRVREMIRFFIDGANFIQSCWEWESPIRSCVTFVIFLVVTYNFQMYMFPMAFLLIFLRVNIARTFRPHSEEDDEEKYFDDDDDEDKDKEEKKTLKEKLQAVQEVALTVQVALGKVASVWESIKKYLKLYS